MFKPLLLVYSAELWIRRATALSRNGVRKVDGLSTGSRCFAQGHGPGHERRRRGCHPHSPRPAHLHALNVPQHDIPDSLVVSSDVGVRAAFPGEEK